MALVRIALSRDYMAGYALAFGTNTGFIQAVTLVDSAGASVTGGGDASAANQLTQITAEQAILAKLNASIAVTGTFYQATQPVSGTFWQATQPVSIAGTVTTTGPLTNTQLRAEAVDVQDATVGNAVLAELNGATATSRILSAAATTNATSAKASAGSVRTVSGYNARSSAVYLKFYNKASAPTVGSDTPRKTVYLPATSAFCLDFRDYYATGIAFALTTGSADADTGALTAGDILGLNVDYV